MNALSDTAGKKFAAASNRWLVVASVAIIVGVFVGLHRGISTEYVGVAVNDISWWLASLTAAVLCWQTARVTPQAERLAWSLLSLACGSWFAGQTVWNYYEVIHGALPAFPHWMQVLFSAYDWIFVAGLLSLPRPAESKQLTPRHIGNLALLVFSIGAVLLLALLEPAMTPGRNPISNLIVLTHSLGLAAMFVTALYLLWSHRWQGLYWPLVLLLAGAGLHMATYVAYIHDLLIGTYVAENWINVSWLLVFGAYAAAAYERSWQVFNNSQIHVDSLRRRERVLEALVPAVLIACVVGVAWRYREWLTSRTAVWMLLPSFGFAAALGLREAWIQRQEQSLLQRLHDTNASLQSANRDLQHSESRYRTLNAELEGRVAERTVELESAYRELENFSYAVAHDLKAPLRAVDGFGAMLAQDYAKSLDDKGRHYLERIRGGALRMSELIDDLLAYARVDRREMQVKSLNLATVANNVVQEQRDEIANFGAQLECAVPPLFVRADEAGLTMALRNLLQNAVKFSRQAQPPRIRIDAQAAEGAVIVSVRDNGIGFDMAYQDRIFEMFQRLHRADEIPGTGIGLAIVRKAVERMNGKVWAESKPGEGATFYIRLLRG